MVAFSPYAQRQTRIFGTAGCLEGDGVRITLRDFATGEVETLESTRQGPDGRHDAADEALADAFVEALASGDPAPLLSDGRESLDSHRVVWAAERARHAGSVVDIALPEGLPPQPPAKGIATP